jgi:hypothetical protein
VLCQPARRMSSLDLWFPLRLGRRGRAGRAPRPSPARGARDAVPRSGAALIQKRLHSAAQMRVTLSCSTVLSDHVKLRSPCSGFCLLRSVTAIDFSPPSAWNGSWDDARNNPSAASAVSAIVRAIRAASALGARGRTSCKRQASGSIPLTGSRSEGVSGLCLSRLVERTLRAEDACRHSGFRYGRWRLWHPSSVGPHHDAMNAQPAEHPEDPQWILRELPDRERANFSFSV